MQTLQDLIERGEAAPYEVRVVVPAGGTVPHFHCRCGRVVPADRMLDLAPPDAPGVPEAIRGKDRFRCDGCWSGWIMRGRISRSDLRAATAQPPLPGDAQ